MTADPSTVLRDAMALTLEKFASFGSMDLGIVWCGMQAGGVDQPA